MRLAACGPQDVDAAAHVADVLWTYIALELFELLVLRRGWTPARFSRFAAEAMINELLCALRRPKGVEAFTDPPRA